MIMDTTMTGNIVQQQQSAYALMKLGKRGAAALIATDCCNIAATISQQQQEDNGDSTVEATLVSCKLLDNMLDVLLNPYDAIGEWNNLDWLRWLMAGGKTLDEFSSAVKNYDYGTCCGLVWTANYVAYRCRTCSISPCMSLCGDCFKRGDHAGHDFNMFRSQAGGACDCGDPSVMKPDGFCHKHSNSNINDTSNISIISFKQPPVDLLRVAERIMPRIFLRLVQYLRENSKMADSKIGNSHLSSDVTNAGINQPQNVLLVDLDPFLSMLHDLSGLGAAMRRVMTISLINEKIYRWACDYYSTNGNVVSNDSSSQQTIYTIYTDKVRRYYNDAIHQYTTISSRGQNQKNKSNTGNPISSNSSVNNSEEDFDDELEQDDLYMNNGQKNKLNHSNFLQEIVFWTVRYEFPQKMVCLLLNLLPDPVYKESLTEAFVMHYGCIARVLATTRDSDTLSNHIVHISVQLFSNEALATRMVDKLGLLRVMVSSLRRMMTKILIPSTINDIARNKHRVVDCSKTVMKEHCYWPLVSDLNNVLSHRPIAVKFMCDDRLLHSWFSYLSMFQGMNVNCRELGHHVEFEPNTYYAAFSAELEASAYPMWAMVSHLTSPDTLQLATRVLRACLQRLRKWLIDIGYYNNQNENDIYVPPFVAQRPDDSHQFTFHLPLHRYFAVFLCQAVRAQGASVQNIIQCNENDTTERDELLLAIATHPIRAQAAFYEIMQGSWIRNGLQIKGQAMTYIQSNFCISMVDADIYLIQLCISELSDSKMLMSLILEKFKVYDWMHIIKKGSIPQIMNSPEYNASNMESLLMFLATLVGVRTNLCEKQLFDTSSDKDYDYCQTQLEMVTLLCVSDKTHSQLMELMPERCGVGLQTTAPSTNTSSSSNSTQNLPSFQQELPPSTRDFETVLKALADYKRPQFEASGNMQQGLYIPLAHVWRNLYDPVHVLLRAVHRRDFQSSMDRYTAFMRSIGLLRQNQTPWPPYKTPQNHHSAYKDPRRVLLSKLFHTVVWHSLYRSVIHRDVSEHTLSLLIYLLDQAWICYNNTSVANDNKMDFMSGDNKNSMIVTNDNVCPKRHIKITADNSYGFNTESESEESKKSAIGLLDGWYEHDDLAINLCTTITHIELPPPYFHYYFTPENTINPVVTSTIANTIFHYLSTSATSTLGSHNFTTVNSHEQPNVIPPMDAERDNGGIPVSFSNPNESDSNNSTRSSFYNFNMPSTTTTTSTMDSALNCVKQRLQFLRPPPQKMMSPNIEELQSTSGQQQLEATNDVDSCDVNARCDQSAADAEFMEETEAQHSLISINESIISLLLRLHSHLSGNPNSYQPPPLLQNTTSNLIDEMKTTTEPVTENDNLQEEIPCGDGAYYVGRLLNKIAKNRSCYDSIVRTRFALWPKAVVMREKATREDEERERRERKRRALNKQQKLLKEMEQAQKAFLENFTGDLDPTDTQLQSPNLCSNMECEEVLAMDTSTTNTQISGDSTNTSLSNLVINIDDSNNSTTTTTTKEPVTHIHQQLSTVDCVICNQTVVVQMSQQYCDPIGLIILVQGTNVLSHRRHILPSLIHASKQYNRLDCNNSQQQIDEDENYYRYWPTLPPFKPQQSTSNDTPQLHNQSMIIIDEDDTTTYLSHSDRRKRLMNEYFNNLNKAESEIGVLTTSTYNNTPIVANVHVQTCGHHLHLRCWNSYLSSLRGTQRFNADRGEYSCPLCRQLANSLMPLIPSSVSSEQQQQKRVATYNTKTDMSYAMKELTNLIVYHESILMKPVSISHNNLMGESSNSITNTEQLFDNEIYFRHRLHDNEFSGHEVDEKTGTGEDVFIATVNRCVSDMIATTIISTTVPSILLTSIEQDNLYKVRWYSVVSIAWTNIHLELVQRNNNLIEQPWSTLCCDYFYCQDNNDANISSNNNYFNMLPKRNCLAPLLKILRASAQWLVSKYPSHDQNPITDIWYKLIGIEEPQQNNMMYSPLLLRDPCNVLLQLLLLLPVLDDDLFDTLVKLTYNMQVFISALKVTTSLNHGPSMTLQTTTEDTHTGMDNIGAHIGTNLDNGNSDVMPPSSLMMDVTECTAEALLSENQHTQFSKAVAFANSIVFLTQDEDKADDVYMEVTIENEDKYTMFHHDGNKQMDIPLAALHENKGDASSELLFERYGRQCTLPFLRFAALLKKYMIENDNIEDHDNVLIKTSLPQQQQPLSTSQTQYDHHGNETRLVEEANYDEDSTKCSSSPYCRCHWSRDDREFLMLARYLNLLNDDKEKAFMQDKKCRSDINNCKNSQGEMKQCSTAPLRPPSAIEAMTWPQSYSVSVDNIDTTISRTWLMSFRKSLTTPKPITIEDNKVPADTSSDACAIICPADVASTSSSKVNQNLNTTISTTNITMAARLLLGVDCCDGSKRNSRRSNNGNNSNTPPSNGLDLLPIIQWTGPHLLRLPHLYDDVFQFYHGRHCFRCHGIPRETSVCLVCGTVVCLKENCCKTSGTYEAVQHSLECGGSTGIFLVVTSSSVVVVRGKRACLWGSVYLDAFGEEDRELKRGKPLYLSAERYRLLEHQWLAHRFDHTNKKWVWHRDAL